MLGLGLRIKSDRLASGFSPDQVAGLIGAWVGDDVAAGAVSSWPGAYGTSSTATQITGSFQPIAVDDVINGHRIVRFDGADDTMTHSVDVGSAAFSAFAVASRTNGASNYQIITFAGQPVLVGRTAASAEWGTFMGSDILSGQSINGAFTSIGVVARNFDDVDLITNGSSVTRVTGSSWLNNGEAKIGSANGSTQFFAGDVAEILIYNSAISAEDSAAVTDFLLSKYALP